MAVKPVEVGVGFGPYTQVYTQFFVVGFHVQVPVEEPLGVAAVKAGAAETAGVGNGAVSRMLAPAFARPRVKQWRTDMVIKSPQHGRLNTARSTTRLSDAVPAKPSVKTRRYAGRRDGCTRFHR